MNNKIKYETLTSFQNRIISGRMHIFKSDCKLGSMDFYKNEIFFINNSTYGNFKITPSFKHGLGIMFPMTIAPSNLMKMPIEVLSTNNAAGIL